MNLFGVGPMELLIILVLAFLVLGPAKMGSMARKLGGVLKDARKMAEGLPRTLDDLAKKAEETALGQAEGTQTPAQKAALPKQAPGPLGRDGPTPWKASDGPARPPSPEKPPSDA